MQTNQRVFDVELVFGATLIATTHKPLCDDRIRRCRHPDAGHAKLGKLVQCRYLINTSHRRNTQSSQGDSNVLSADISSSVARNTTGRRVSCEVLVVRK